MIRRSLMVVCRVRDLVTCKRCGAPDLVWMKGARTGKSYLVQAQRSYDRATRTEEVRASKIAFHNCEQYLRDKHARETTECPGCHVRMPNAEVGEHVKSCRELAGIAAAAAASRPGVRVLSVVDGDWHYFVADCPHVAAVVGTPTLCLACGAMVVKEEALNA